MKKRLLAIIATAAMVVAMMPTMVFAAPVVNGDVINVADATEAQKVLDGEYGKNIIELYSLALGFELNFSSCALNLVFFSIHWFLNEREN